MSLDINIGILILAFAWFVTTIWLFAVTVWLWKLTNYAGPSDEGEGWRDDPEAFHNLPDLLTVFYCGSRLTEGPDDDFTVDHLSRVEVGTGFPLHPVLETSMKSPPIFVLERGQHRKVIKLVGNAPDAPWKKWVIGQRNPGLYAHRPPSPTEKALDITKDSNR